MITIPMSRVAIDLQLPDPKPAEEPPPDQKPDQIVLEVLPGPQFLINKTAYSKEQLPAQFKQIYDPRPDKILFVKGDPNVKYQEIIWSMDVARGGGVKVIGIPPKSTGEAPK
jgi:biopolymer transport protein ExbD